MKIKNVWSHHLDDFFLATTSFFPSSIFSCGPGFFRIATSIQFNFFKYMVPTLKKHGIWGYWIPGSSDVCKFCAFSPEKYTKKAEIFTYLDDPGIFLTSWIHPFFEHCQVRKIDSKMPIYQFQFQPIPPLEMNHPSFFFPSKRFRKVAICWVSHLRWSFPENSIFFWSLLGLVISGPFRADWDEEHVELWISKCAGLNPATPLPSNKKFIHKTLQCTIFVGTWKKKHIILRHLRHTVE